MNIHVSDHAIRRFIERIGTTLTPEELKVAIAMLVEPATSIRLKRYTYNNDVTFCLSYGADFATVTTVYEGASKRKKPSRRVRDGRQVRDTDY